MTTVDDRMPGGLSAAKRELLARRLRGAAAPARTIPAHTEPDRAPLAPAQRTIWILDHYLGPSGLYNIDQCLWINGPLDASALGQALDDVLERHQVLRATTPVPAAPVQVFGQHRRGVLRVTDLTGADQAGRRQQALDLARQAVAEPFDLAAGPVIRAVLFRLTDTEHLLALALHHLVGDERSMEILHGELAGGYAARLTGRQAMLPELPVQYRDYAAWQAARPVDDQLDYWQRALSGLPAVLDLPADHPRRPVPSHRGDRVHIQLPDEVRTGVVKLADQLSCTTFTVLLSAFAALMHRYSGQDTLAVGTLLAGRDRSEVENLIGLFASPAALVAEFGAAPAFADLVLAMHRRVGEALAHQDVSFEQVVEAVRPDRDLSANPLFQVLYQQEDLVGQDWDLPGLRVRPTELDSVQAKVDLTLFTSDDGHALSAYLVFATDLYTRDTASRILAHYGRLLADAVHRPGEPVSRLRLLSRAERTTALFHRNDTRAGYPADACLHELFEAQADRVPGAIALAGNGLRVSYAELDGRANQLARHLRELGVRAETPVGVCLETGPDLFVALLGILKAGGAYVPADPSHPAGRLAYVLSDTAAAVAITQESLTGLLRGCQVNMVRMDTDAGLLDSYPADRLGRTTGAENLVYVMYTSGSTGRPKGVMISHRALINYLWWAIDGYGLGGAHGAPMVGSIAFDLSVPNFFLPLIGGRDVTLLPQDRSQQALAELLLEPGDFSLLKITPAHLDALRALLPAGATVTSVRTYVIGADEVKPETIAAWRRIAPQARLIDEYGPTETVVGCSVYEIGAGFDPARPVSIGRPIANMTMYVLDKHLEPVPPGVVGELFVGGAGVARGYLGRAALTADRFLPDPYGETGARFYRTGDLARTRSDGNLEFLGRTDHQVKIRGYRIELGEIEAQLLLQPQVREAVVAVREDRPGARKLIAYVVPGTGGADPGELREALRAVMPDYMVPAAIVILDSMPLSPGGKVDRRLLPLPQSGQAGAAGRPATETERVLAGLWAELLDLPQVGVDDNFFEVGGDSLLAIQLAVQARNAGLALTPRLVFQHQTLRTLAAAVGQAEPAEPRDPADAAAGLQPAEVAMSPSQLRLLSSAVRREYHVPGELLFVRRPVPASQIEQMLREVVNRHQALRLRLDEDTRGLRSVPAETASLLTEVTAPMADIGQVAEALRASLDLTHGPVLRGTLIHSHDGDRLMILAHHLAVDNQSWQVILDELAAQWPAPDRRPLPAPGPQFGTWSARLHELADTAELTAEAPYWLAMGEGSAIPVDRPGGANAANTAQTVTATLSAPDTRALIRAHRSRTGDLVLAALTLTLTGWTGQDSVTVEVAGHGRDEIVGGIEPSGIVGWLSAGYPVTLSPSADRDPVATLTAVSRSLREIPRSGIGYGLLRYVRDDQIARQLAARRPPDVVVNYEGRYQTAAEDLPCIRLVDVPDVEAVGAGPRTHLLLISSLVIDGQLIVGWTYSDQVHTAGTMEHLAQECMDVLRALAESGQEQGLAGA